MESSTKEYLTQVMDEMPVEVFIDICKGIQAHQCGVLNTRNQYYAEAVQRITQAKEDARIAGELAGEAAEELKTTEAVTDSLEAAYSTPEDLVKPLSQVDGINREDIVKNVAFMLGMVG